MAVPYFQADENKALEAIQQRFIKYEETEEDIGKIKPEIYESWVRSRASKVNPVEVKYAMTSPDQLERTLQEHNALISTARSYMTKLYSFVEEERFFIIISDENGCILDIVGGTGKAMQKSKAYTHLKIGVKRNEAYAGTNGVGTCLAIKMPIQIRGAEHYVKAHHEYASSAAPIHDGEGNIIGCLNMIGPKEANHRHTLGMIVAAVDGIEKEIQLRDAYKAVTTINSHLNGTLQSIADGVIMLDEDGVIIQHNTNAISFLKLPSASLIGCNLADIVTIETPFIDVLHLEKNFYNQEVSVTTAQNKSVDLTLTACIMAGEGREKEGTVITFNSTNHLHKVVNQRSGFVAKYTFDSIIGDSPPIAESKMLGRIASQSDSNVLILGESGTGKELVAQAIHSASRRAEGPFIAINCGSLPKGLIESELFGYEGGAFTGASKEGRPGKFELADRGTIFLDEIGDMPLDLQASLLRVLQFKEIVRIGGKRPKPVNVRIIAATNRNLEESIENNVFRSDLYYRLNVFSICIPPLRERKRDLTVLVDSFIKEYSQSMNKNISGISEEAMDMLTAHGWPGNVRELQNVIERAINITESQVIEASSLPGYIIHYVPPVTTSVDIAPPNLPSQSSAQVQENGQKAGDKAGRGNTMGDIKELEKELILQTLTKTAGNVTRASRMLGIGRKSLYCKLEAYHIDMEQFRSI